MEDGIRQGIMVENSRQRVLGSVFVKKVANRSQPPIDQTTSICTVPRSYKYRVINQRRERRLMFSTQSWRVDEQS